MGWLLLGPALGAERAAPILPEHVLRSEHLTAMTNALDPEHGLPVLVMSVETYRLLLPLYSAERQGARTSADGSYMHFRWSTRQVIVLPGLDIAVRPDQMDQPNHLFTGTRRAAEELDVRLPGRGEAVMVLSGDWRGGLFDLAELARREGLAGETQIVPGLIAVSLDLEAYGRALDSGGS
jgi:hypothetical protein